MTPDTLRELLIIGVLIGLNAIFVAAEIAFVTVRRTRLDQPAGEGSRSARRARDVVADPARFLAVIQLGITFIGFLASAYAADSLTLALERTFDEIELVAPYSEALALLIVTAVLSIVTIVFGELVPKSFALRHTERFALLLAAPIDIIGHVLAPVVWFLTKVTNLVTRGTRGTRQEDTVLGSEELRRLVEQSREQGVIEAEESQMIGAIFDLGARRVHEVMVPRTDVVAIRADTSVREALHALVECGRSASRPTRGASTMWWGCCTRRTSSAFSTREKSPHRCGSSCGRPSSFRARRRSTTSSMTSSDARCNSRWCWTSAAAPRVRGRWHDRPRRPHLDGRDHRPPSGRHGARGTSCANVAGGACRARE